MANREAFKEYGRLIEREAEGERARQQRPQAKVGKSLGKELTRAVQGAIAGMPKQQNSGKAQMQLNPQGDKLKGWGRALK